MLLACVLMKYLSPAWLDQCRVATHQVSSAMGKWDTKHSYYIDLEAQHLLLCSTACGAL